MARSRNIKPSIMDNDELGELPPLTRLLFIYLWMLADREGRLEDRPKRIAAQALPFDRDADVGAMLDELHASGFICRYSAAGVACIQIVAFAKHQTPHVREAASSLPAPGHDTATSVTEHNLGSAEAQPRQCLGSVEASPRSPDSLIPDSLIPDSSIPNGIEAGEPASDPPPAAESPRSGKRVPELTVPELVADGLSESLAAEFLAHRRGRRAKLTPTAWAGICAEAGKAGLTASDAAAKCIARGWTGFEAAWVAQDRPHGREPPPNRQTALEARNREIAQRWASQHTEGAIDAAA